MLLRAVAAIILAGRRHRIQRHRTRGGLRAGCGELMSVWYIGVQVVYRVGARRGLFGALFLAALLAGPLTFAVSPAFEQGESLFLLDRPLDAQPLLERAILDEPANEAAYLYLGLAYEQVQEHEKAVQVLQRGAALGGERQCDHPRAACAR